MLVEERRLSSQREVVQRFTRTTPVVVSMIPSTGINGSGFDMEMLFTLNQTSYYIAGLLFGNNSNPGASDFTALYDQYKLEGIELAFMYSQNVNAGGAPATSAFLPIMNIVFDPNDVSVISLSSILQYSNLKTVQLGNLRTEQGYVLRCKPTPLTTVGAQATAGVSATWLNCDTPVVPHYGVKMFYDNGGSTLATVIGNLTIYVKYHWAFRLAH